jgi:F-type H+-transporting ATPase subunit gamma
MLNARVVKKRIGSVINIKKITKTMEMVATTKSQRAVKQVKASKSFLANMYQILNELQKEDTDLSNPILNEVEKKSNKIYVFLVTSNRGLCGSYNANVIRTAMTFYRKMKKENKEVIFNVIGKKGISALKYAYIPIEKSYVEIDEKVNYNKIEEIGTEILNGFLNNQYDEAYIITTELRSSTTFKPIILPLLPMKIEMPSFLISEIQKTGEASEYVNNYEIEPDIETIFDYSVPILFNSIMFHRILEANASEQISRRIAMQQATDAATQMIKDLTRTYNRARQYKITQEISEIVSGADALS